ncbi:uncharacterized protein LOC115940311 [Leptonychotes weddellii]|uniref:Uncharacterized protein LOC115940311 n=1 Tax=Leptonychotes weddellii TaxID=9713 RepID=A0A7F8QMH8_LEPWE|nr:uncharacterized protein LOC115940311 [Leptonychotes weddellii]
MTGVSLLYSLPKLLVLGLELLVLRGQVDVVLQDTSQQASVVMLSGHGLLLPQPSPGSEYLCPDSEMPVSQSALEPLQGLPSDLTDLQHMACLSSGSLHVQVIEGCEVPLRSVLLCLKGLQLEPQHCLLPGPSLPLLGGLQ